jgi:phenylacetate-CoA ligase
MEILNDFITLNGGTTLPIGAAALDEEIHEMIQTFHANTICGMPPRLVQFAHFLKSKGIQLPSVQNVLYGGEPLYEARVVLLREVFGRGVRISSIYGSAETGIWAIQPPTVPRECYVIHSAIVHVEIVDPNDKGIGRVVVTNLVRCQHPVVRYDTGDVGRLETVEGRQGLRLVGRNVKRNSFTFGTEYYSASELEAVCPALAEAVDYQLVLRLDVAAHTELLCVSLSPQLNADVDVAIIQNQLATAIFSNESDSVVRSRIVVQIVPPSLLIRSVTAGKTLRIVDER